MSGSSDSEDIVEMMEIVPRKDSYGPLVLVLCLLCYIYGMWLGMYVCPK